MTDTNIEQKETFENIFKEIYENDCINSTGVRKVHLFHLQKLKQLHNKEIQNLSQRNIVKMMKEKDDKIKELQAENTIFKGQNNDMRRMLKLRGLIK